MAFEFFCLEFIKEAEISLPVALQFHICVIEHDHFQQDLVECPNKSVARDLVC